jgi:hypothetical protein
LDYYVPPPKPPRRRWEAPGYVGVVALLFSTLGFPCCFGICGGLMHSYLVGDVAGLIGQFIGLAASIVSFRSTSGKLGFCLSIFSVISVVAYLLG